MFSEIRLLMYYTDSRQPGWHTKYYYATVVYEYIAGSSVTVAEVREAIVYSTEANGLEQTLLQLTLITVLTDASLTIIWVFLCNVYRKSDSMRDKSRLYRASVK